MDSVDRAQGGTPDIVPDRTEAATTDLRCLVTLSRQAKDDVGHRQILAQIDRGRTATLLFGDAVTLEVTPGSHVLRANNTLFWKRVPFSIEPGEHLEFVLINRSGRLTLGFLAIMGVAPLYLSIERRSLA